jgi:hypothetical protein
VTKSYAYVDDFGGTATFPEPWDLTALAGFSSVHLWSMRIPEWPTLVFILGEVALLVLLVWMDERFMLFVLLSTLPVLIVLLFGWRLGRGG